MNNFSNWGNCYLSWKQKAESLFPDEVRGAGGGWLWLQHRGPPHRAGDKVKHITKCLGLPILQGSVFLGGQLLLFLMVHFLIPIFLDRTVSREFLRWIMLHILTAWILRPFSQWYVGVFMNKWRYLSICQRRTDHFIAEKPANTILVG